MRHMYANLTVMTVLNLNHFYIMQAELYLKGTSVKTSFTIATIFYIFIKNPRRKKFINRSCPKHPKIIN